ncbi:hypothetical protein KKG22_03770 [Patescibacteria group bacterium]|nr:hypothetical protein [Patescibacteria group bacterium]MBU1721265.1 hypothetical protein [Patescibacteria group bacterium]MBU1901027.1 hypothetical protein [Patescibacteria group bacterium]
MSKIFYPLICLICSIIPLQLHAAMTGGDFEIYADVFSTIEEHVVSGGDYDLYGTSGEFGTEMPSGGDYVLRAGFQAMERESLSLTLDKNAIDLGALTSDAISSDTLTCTVTTDAISGYNITISEDTDLQTGTGLEIDDVIDGEVTAGSEEYGIKTAGTAGQYNAADTAILSTTKIIAQQVGAVSSQDTGVIFRAAADAAATEAGNYSHTVTFTATINL